MRRDLISDRASGDVWAADDKWDVDVLFVATFLPRRQPMLPDMIAVIAGVEHVGILQDVIVVKKLENIVNEFVNRLKSTEPRAVEFIVVFDLGITLSR